MEGLVSDPARDKQSIIACDHNEKRVGNFVSEHGVVGTISVQDAARRSSVVVLAVKPRSIERVLGDIRQSFSSEDKLPIIVSVVAGVDVNTISRSLELGFKVVRVMPNLPCLIGQGMSALYSRSADSLPKVENIFRTIGLTAVVNEEADLDSATGLSGSGPAFVFLFIEALADGGVKMGLSRDNALLMAAQTVLGSSALVLESGLHPAELKDMVASPGGTTIEGVYSLEKSAFSGSVISAVTVATEKAKSLMRAARSSE